MSCFNEVDKHEEVVSTIHEYIHFDVLNSKKMFSEISSAREKVKISIYLRKVKIRLFINAVSISKIFHPNLDQK